MRLKVSYKTALKVVDVLIAVGHSAIRKRYYTDVESTGDFCNWFERAEDSLVRIFEHYAPVYRVMKCEKETDKQNHSLSSLFNPNTVTDKGAKQIGEALDILVEYYDYFVSQEKSPVRYLPDKAEIWLYDLCCSLEPESNESELCCYMFNLGIGEWVEIAEVHKVIVGQEYDPKGKNKNVVVNALDGVNRKTKDAFYFQLLKKRKSVVALAIPPRFILEQK